jgi:hypothetical protein
MVNAGEGEIQRSFSKEDMLLSSEKASFIVAEYILRNDK